jgi:thiol:disulfide interchange protein
MRAVLKLAILLLGISCAFAQKTDQVKWDLRLEPASAPPGAKVLARMTAHIDPGWHMYSMSTAQAIPTTISLAANPVVERYRVLQPPPRRAFDPNFGGETETYEQEAVFLVELQLKKDAPPGMSDVSVTARYQTCNDKECIPPVKRTGTATLKIDPTTQVAAVAIPSGYAEPKAQTTSAATDQGWWAFLLVAFGFGLATIFTPCVFPMIPITMSYFLNRESGGRRDTVSQAVVFCLGIIVLFSALGLLVTAIVGPAGVAQLGGSPWVNGFIAALFLVFGLSLLGAFEITIPSSILTRLNRSSEKGGFAGTLLMGLTFSLASFACVGPFVGTLLAASLGAGNLARPVAGMVTFAAGLAMPFFLLALFPSYLKRMPRSGGWLARVKVVMGFVILAASLKYLASMDQVLGWGLLTRDRFLAAWIVLSAMAGLYLLGFLRLEGIKPEDRMGLGRLLTGMAFLVLALTFLPGMSGAKLGFWESYVPAADTSGGTGSTSGLVWLKNQYREALDQARRESKLVFVNFTGYACANCHWMEGNMFPRPEIASALKNFVLVELYTDGTDAASDTNQKLEASKFNTIATPFYAILDANENVITTSAGRTTDPQEYLAFLQKGAAGPSASPQATADSAGLPQVTALNGGAVDTKALSGKVVVVNFWATWCVPCVHEIPGFNKMHHQYGPKGVVVLGVSMDDDGAAQVRPFLKTHPMDYQVAIGSSVIFEQYKIDELPVTVVFDRSGKQLKRFDGLTDESDIEAAVQQAL